MKQFTVTSPTNALAVVIYVLLAFTGFMTTTNLTQNGSADRLMGSPMSDVWSTLLFLSASAAVYAVLSAPKRRDPDTSLVIEYWACISLCSLLIWFEYLMITSEGPKLTNSIVFTVIFLIGFACRAGQIFVERRALRRFRATQQ